MRLRSSRVVEQELHSNQSKNSLSDFELSLLHSLMSQHNNMSAHGSDRGEPDPIDQEMIRPLRDYLYPHR